MLNAILKQVSVEDYCGRVKQMEEAYGIIYFTALFDELDSRLLDNIRRNLQLSLKERKNLFCFSTLPEDAGSNRREIMFPDMFCGYDEVKGVLQDMYGSMAIRYRDFARGDILCGHSKRKNEEQVLLPDKKWKKLNIAVATVARELACFVWGMVTENIEEKAA